MKKGDNDSRGFTIIEVALVLAIAGLICLMVFVALPGLRASQRDTSRREDMMSLIDGIKRYQQNNRGTLPSDWVSFFGEYMGGDKFNDPDGPLYKPEYAECGKENQDNKKPGETPCYSGSIYDVLEGLPDRYTILILKQASCTGETPIYVSNPRKMAVVYRLEGSGVYCANT